MIGMRVWVKPFAAIASATLLLPGGSVLATLGPYQSGNSRAVNQASAAIVTVSEPDADGSQNICRYSMERNRVAIIIATNSNDPREFYVENENESAMQADDLSVIVKDQKLRVTYKNHHLPDDSKTRDNYHEIIQTLQQICLKGNDPKQRDSIDTNPRDIENFVREAKERYQAVVAIDNTAQPEDRPASSDAQSPRRPQRAGAKAADSQSRP